MTTAEDFPEISVPEVTRLGDSVYNIKWGEDVEIEVTKIYEHRDYHVDAEIMIKDYQELNPVLLPPQRYTLTRSPRYLLQDLEKVSSRDWLPYISLASYKVMEGYRQGEPIYKLGEMDRPSSPRFAIDPIAYAGTPTLIYGPGGIGKSMLSLYLATMMHNGVTSGAGLSMESGKVLYLDYETTKEENWLRSYDVLGGLGLPRETVQDRMESMVYYRFCKSPLVHEVESLQRQIADLGIEVVFVDSAGPACGGEPESANSTINFFSALRALGTADKPLTSITIGHVAKGFGGSSSGPFGSVYWVNNPRSTWELKKSQKEGASHIDLALHHKKVNMGPLHRPIGFSLDYNNGVRLESKVLSGSATDEDDSVPTRAFDILSQSNGAYANGMTTRDLAELLEYPNPRSLSSMLSRDTRFRFSQDTNVWELNNW